MLEYKNIISYKFKKKFPRILKKCAILPSSLRFTLLFNVQLDIEIEW
jgi:hypothetical protein